MVDSHHYISSYSQRVKCPIEVTVCITVLPCGVCCCELTRVYPSHVFLISCRSMLLFYCYFFHVQRNRGRTLVSMAMTFEYFDVTISTQREISVNSIISFCALHRVFSEMPTTFWCEGTGPSSSISSYLLLESFVQ